MDFIKKTICLEGARTRTQGLMPYYEFGTGNSGRTIADGPNGNWGEFVANPYFLAVKDKTYETMLHNYYELLNMVRDGIRLRKVSTKDNEVIFTEDLGAFSWNEASQCFDGGHEPDFLYEYAAYNADDFYFVNHNSLKEETKRIYRYTGDETISENFIVLIDRYDYFLRLSKYLEETDYLEAAPSGITALNPVHIYGENEEEEPNIHYEWARYCQVVDLCIGKINIPSWIYNEHIKVPKSMPCADVEEYIEWLTDYPASGDCCNSRLWEDRGGNDMLRYLTQSGAGKCDTISKVLNDLDYYTPFIELPLLLIRNYTDVGVLTTLDGFGYDKELSGASSDDEDELTRPHGKFRIGSSGFTNLDASGNPIDEIGYVVGSGVGVTLDEIIMDSSRETYPTTEEFEENPSAYTYKKDGRPILPIEVESLLKTLRDKKKYTDDKDNVLPGLFQTFSGEPSGKMFRCIKQGKETFYDLAIVQDEYEDSGITYHTLEYFWTKNDSYTKKDINPSNFYQDFPEVPYGKFTVGENESDWQEQYNERLSIMEDYATPSAHTPISVAINEWRMEEIPYSVTAFTNGDGEQSENVHYRKDEINNIEGKHYRTITTCATGIRIAETEEEENGEDQPFMEHYYFKVKYDNSPEKPMTLPYKIGNRANTYALDNAGLYRGDFISSDPVIENGKIEFEYVIGGQFNVDDDGAFIAGVPGTGDVYKEKYTYQEAHCDYVAIDGVDNVPIWSNYIDFDGAAKEFYSTRYNLSRTGNTANIVEATTGDIWREDYSFDSYLAKEEYLINFSLPPKVDVNVTIDRGGVSAFEKHYKLAECNTMQDLVNYGNNFFNL